MADAHQTQAVITLDASQVPVALSVAEAHGVKAQQVEQRGVEPVTSITLVLAGSAAAVATVLHMLDQSRGGQVIDLRPGAPKALYRTTDLAYGMVVIIAVDGKVEVVVKQPDGMFGNVIAALPALLTGRGVETRQVVQAVTNRFGTHVAVETVEKPADGVAGSPIRILLLAANPLSTGRLAIDEEARAITQKLRLSRDRDTFKLITCWAVRPGDLLQYLNQYRPHVVHFSGHGARAGQILLSTGDGAGMPVAAEALAELFRVMREDVRVVLLNACYTTVQAQAIIEHVDFVIGTRVPITDEAAMVFAAAFYSALGFGRTVLQAFDQARTALMINGLPGHDAPELLVRPDADPHLSSVLSRQM